MHNFIRRSQAGIHHLLAGFARISVFGVGEQVLLSSTRLGW